MFEGFEDAPALPGWIERDLPFDRRVARIGGRRIHLVDHGRGVPVLLMHGNPTWSYLWRKVIGALPLDRVRVIAPDLLGLGLSDKPRSPEAHTLARHVGIMTELVAALELDEMVVVGQDWGGPISAGVARNHASKVRGLVFGNTSVLAPGQKIRSTTFHKVSRLPVLSDLLFRGLGFPLFALRQAQGDPSSIDMRAMLAYMWPLKAPWKRAAPMALARMVPDSRDHPSVPLLTEIGGFVESFEGPIELVWGTRDPILGRSLKRHRRKLAHAEVTQTNAGHFLQEEVPGELADAIMRVVGKG